MRCSEPRRLAAVSHSSPATLVRSLWIVCLDIAFVQYVHRGRCGAAVPHARRARLSLAPSSTAELAVKCVCNSLNRLSINDLHRARRPLACYGDTCKRLFFDTCSVRARRRLAQQHCGPRQDARTLDIVTANASTRSSCIQYSVPLTTSRHVTDGLAHSNYKAFASSERPPLRPVILNSVEHAGQLVRASFWGSQDPLCLFS